MSELYFSLFCAEVSDVVICMPLSVFMEQFYAFIHNTLRLSNRGSLVKDVFAFNKQGL